MCALGSKPRNPPVIFLFPYGKVKTQLPALIAVLDPLRFCLPGSGIPVGWQGGAMNLNLGNDKFILRPFVR